MAVVVEVAGSDRFPARPRIGGHPAADDAGSVHVPDRGLTIGVLPQEVWKAIVIEVARSYLFPTRPRIGANGSAGDHMGPVHSPDRGPPIGVLK